VSRTALIVGAGIGGLSAAIALRKAGWKVRVFERASTPRELGFGLALAPNAMAALGELGVADVVSARGFVPRRAEFRRPDGSVLKRIELPASVVGGPVQMALRPALHGALLEAVPPDAITLGALATGFDQHNGVASARFADGTRIEGDLIVGADGIDSTIRRTLHPDEPPPRPSGVVAVRGATHGAIDHLGECDAVRYSGRGIEAMCIRASGTGIYWFVSLNRDLLPCGMTDAGAIAARVSPQFDQTFRAVATASSDLRFDELADRDPLASWGQGVVTLLGDAAHPMLPQTGQGAAQAIIDGATLGRVLSGSDTVENGLRRYEAERIKTTTGWVRRGRHTASLMRTTNPAICFARELFVRAIPVKPLVWFYAGRRR
jgi:2-polyprenyl-6-methoxyphenol hydroxylase-like FAD-dependent oxidoreductase